MRPQESRRADATPRPLLLQLEAVPLAVACALVERLLSASRLEALLAAVSAGQTASATTNTHAFESWCRNYALVRDHAGGQWVTAARLGVALLRIDPSDDSLAQNANWELWARTSEADATPRLRTTGDGVLLRALARAFAAQDWPEALSLSSIGEHLVSQLSSGRVQGLLEPYGGRLGRFARVCLMGEQARKRQGVEPTLTSDMLRSWDCWKQQPHMACWLRACQRLPLCRS